MAPTRRTRAVFSMHAEARPWAAWLVAAATLLAWPASAAEALDIAIAGDNPELSRKLRAEIRYAGFAAVDGAAKPGQAAASIRILSADRVQLSVQRPNDVAGFEQVLERRPAEAESFALRVVEVLRARLVDLGWTLPPTSSSAAEPPSVGADDVPAETLATPAPVVAEPPAETAPDADPANDAEPVPSAPATSGAASRGLRFWLGGGATGAWSFGGLGLTPHATLALRADLGADWSAALSAGLPLATSELDAAEGEAEVSWWAYTAAVERTLPLPGAWFGGIGLGAGLFVVGAEGQAQGDFSGRTERLTCGAGFVALSFGHVLNDWLRVRATATAGSTAPRPVLRFDGREVASLGRGYASLGLALELGWPGAGSR